MWRGDIIEDDTIDFKFTTRDGSGPATLSGTPALAVYKGNGTTETTTGITLSVDFDAVTGLNHVRIVTTDAFYVADENYQVVITAGTVGAASVVGEVIAEFSIHKRSHIPVLINQLVEAYAANGVSPTLVEAVFAIHQMLMQFAINGTTYTVKKLDGSTTAFVVTLNAASNPTGASRD